MNSITHLKRMALADKIRNELIAVKGQRDARARHVRTVLGDEPGWVVFERELVQNLVNAELERHGAQPVENIDIISIEQAATYMKGDFTKNFALQAADLILSKTQVAQAA